MKAQNLDKLPRAALEASAVLMLFGYKLFGEPVYMIEVKLDDPIRHLTTMNPDGLKMYSVCKHRSHAQHLGDPEWAVIHESDEDWDVLDKKELYLSYIERLSKLRASGVEVDQNEEIIWDRHQTSDLFGSGASGNKNGGYTQ